MWMVSLLHREIQRDTFGHMLQAYQKTVPILQTIVPVQVDLITTNPTFQVSLMTIFTVKVALLIPVVEYPGRIPCGMAKDAIILITHAAIVMDGSIVKYHHLMMTYKLDGVGGMVMD